MKINSLRPKGPGLGRVLWLGLWGPASLLAGFAPLALLNIAQMATLPLLFLHKPTFRRLNTTFAWLIWGWWVWSLRHLVGLYVEIEGDELPPGETAIVFANHQGMSDIVAVLTVAAERAGMRDVKFMAKNVLKYVPFFGWAMQFVDFIFLKRSWSDDQANIMATFARYRERAEPFWLNLFPEGTRITDAKLAASRDYAAKAGVAPTARVLLPRPKGFIAALQGLSGKVTAVYSLTIDYGGRVPSLVELIRGEVDRVAVRVQRHPVASLPRGERELAHWLTAEFRAKDEWLRARAAKR